MLSLLIFLMGICIGSFLNACIYRIPKKESVITGRSHCMTCHQYIKGYDLIPIISYLFLGGKCRDCKTRLSIQYPVVELLNGVAYLWVYFIFGYTIETIIYCLFTSALITLSFIDWQHKIIPNTINLWIGLLGILHVMLNLEGWTNYLIGFFLVSGILLIIAILSRGQMGMGDVKLMAVSGLILGWQYILLALALGSIVGAFISIALMILKKGGKIVPFGPYLSIGIFISLLYGELIIHWYLTCFLLS